MKKKMKKLQLSRETLTNLSLSAAEGGAIAVDQPGGVKNLSISPCTRVLSDCLTCTQPIDGCPDPTVTIS
ncbi:MAG TPA: hypothetical protein VIE43_04030 [Thermoanaerobaculia bacterium]|jgi:hypothetical protein|nr:hypothetical protein [Thermoanaerobaculia bacterium]